MLNVFEEKDCLQIVERGSSVDECTRQYKLLKDGVPFIKLKRAAVTGDGIVAPTETEAVNYIEKYENLKDSRKIVKFVPASGGATRMFRFLLTLLNEFENLTEEDLIIKGSSDNNCRMGIDFFQGLKDDKFAFRQELEEALEKNGNNLKAMLDNGEYHKILKTFLESEGLNYAGLPKAVLQFHKYGEDSRTPLEEHFVEGIGYAMSGNNLNIHLTVSEEYSDLVSELIDKLTDRYRENGVEVKTDISYQLKSSDTMALGEDGQPFRKGDGKLLFRPGGHGALIENLNSIAADIVFIKNIDNVVPENHLDISIRYKKLLGGILLSIKDRIDEVLEGIEQNHTGIVEKGILLCRELFNKEPDPGIHSDDELMEAMIRLFNKPVRVCGVVKNTGEPGGGPFWVEEDNGGLSLQIVETAQVNSSDSSQMDIIKRATHFNPVDIVCSTLNYRGEKFDLKEYIDYSKSFITEKSVGGKGLKALEHPGLWNGAMAGWITVMVEVPVETFNPVKTVNDLLRPQHQND